MKRRRRRAREEEEERVDNAAENGGLEWSEVELVAGSEEDRRGIIAVEEVEGLTGLNNQGTSPEQRKNGI